MSDTRASVILNALAQEVRMRASIIDKDDELAEVTVTVKLQAGTTWVRGTEYHEERISRRRDHRIVERRHTPVLSST